MGNAVPNVWVATTDRADWSLYRPLLHALGTEATIRRGLLVAGSHINRPDLPQASRNSAPGQPTHTPTEPLAALIEDATKLGWPVAWCAPPLAPPPAPPPATRAERPGHPGHLPMRELAALVGAFAETLSTLSPSELPDALIVLGDRFEMLGLALAASLAGVALVHIHGGEETEGALDNSYRHALSKLAHLHFCATPLARDRLLAMGETPERVVLTGAPGLDDLIARSRGDTALAARLGGAVPDNFALVTLHSETLLSDLGVSTAEALVSALAEADFPLIVTAANADPGSAAINASLQAFCHSAPGRRRFIPSLGVEAYPQALRLAQLVIGNSSSGVIEAASFGVPVVNIGDRQTGRERACNVLDCGRTASEISAAIRTARTEAFRAQAAQARNPYGDGNAAPLMRQALLEFLAAGAPRMKCFHFNSSQT